LYSSVEVRTWWARMASDIGWFRGDLKTILMR